MATFDVAKYLEQDGMTITGPGEEAGTVRIQNSDGKAGTLNVNQLLKENGYEGMNVQYNTPETALNTSPVGLVDRLKMSFGNTKGNTEYLKKQFEAVSVDQDGDMLVKNKGVWQRVDPSGFSNGDGWSVSEMIADAADIAKDVVIGAGTALGAGAGLGVGSIAGAGAGAAAASTASAVLGRYLGTYNVDQPEDIVKDIALDTVLAAGGQGVAIGAAKTIIPKLKQSLSNLGNTLSKESKDVMANFMSQTTGVSKQSADIALNDTTLVNQLMDRIESVAKAPQSVRSGTDELAGMIVSPGSKEAIELAARKQMHGPIKALIGSPHGADTIQKRFSAAYRGKATSFINGVDDATEWTASKPLSEGLSSVGTLMAELGAIEGPSLASGRFVVKSAQTLKDTMGLDIADAVNFRKSVTSYINTATELLDQGATFKGKEGAASYMKAMRSLDDAFYELKDTVPKYADMLTPISSKIKSDMLAIAPQSASKETMGTISQWYSRNMSSVKALGKAAQKGDQGLDDLISKWNTPVFEGTSARGLFETAAELMPNKKAAENTLRLLKGTNAAREFMGTLPTGTLASQLGRGAAVASGTAVLGPAAGAMIAASSSPKLAYKAVQGTTAGLRALNSSMKLMSTPLRSDLLKDPSKLNAILSTALGSGYEGE